MWACYFGHISDEYKNNWKRHPVDGEPDVFDVLADREEIMYRLDSSSAHKYFGAAIQVDWGGWAYRCTKEQMIQYNREASPGDRIPEAVIEKAEDGVVYGIIDVEIY